MEHLETTRSHQYHVLRVIHLRGFAKATGVLCNLRRVEHCIVFYEECTHPAHTEGSMPGWKLLGSTLPEVTKADVASRTAAGDSAIPSRQPSGAYCT